MGRLNADTLDRTEVYAERVLDVVDALEKQSRSHRLLNQLFGSGTSVGANTYEADEAMTAKDFAKSLGMYVKELNETLFWLRIVARRGWIKPTRLEPLIAETVQLRKIFGAMIVRTRRKLRTVPA